MSINNLTIEEWKYIKSVLHSEVDVLKNARKTFEDVRIKVKRIKLSLPPGIELPEEIQKEFDKLFGGEAVQELEKNENLCNSCLEKVLKITDLDE